MSSNKWVVVGGLALILSAAVQAQTACPCGAGTVVATAADLRTLLVGKTVCAVDGNDSWQEFHSPDGRRVWDYKRGPNDPVDPTTAVALYVIGASAGAASISYDYGGGQLYTYTVCQNGASTVNFCGARNLVGATLLTGQVPCSTVAQVQRAPVKAKAR